MPCIGKGHGSGCWQHTEKITENKQRASSLVFITSVKHRGWRIRSSEVMWIQERQRVTSGGLFFLAAQGRMVHREGGKGKIMEIFGPLCTAILSFSPSGPIITELTFTTDSDKTTFLGSCDKTVHHSCPLPREQSKLKLNLSHGLAHFRGLESSVFLPSPEA